VARYLVISLLLAAVLTVSCGTAPVHTADVQALTAIPASPSPSSTPSLAPVASDPTPTPAAPPAPPTPSAASQPSSYPFTFSGLPTGSFPVHVHSACNGSQAFHLATLGSLFVGMSRSGTVTVPAMYVGEGLCLIVYANPSLTSVLSVRRV
jgi:hypothetical protein